MNQSRNTKTLITINNLVTIQFLFQNKTTTF